MIRGWDSTRLPLVNDDTESPRGADAGEYQAADGSNINSHSQTAGGMFGKWEAANQRYEQERVEIIDNTDDNVSITDSVGDSVGCWSLGAGILERESAGNPFDEGDEECGGERENDNGGRVNQDNERSSSPRQGQSKIYGLSMIKEEEDEEDAANGGMFDDVDFYPNRLPSSGHVTEIRALKSDDNDNSGSNGDQFPIVNHVLREFQSNPNLKFKVVGALSIMLVVFCLLAVIIAASIGNEHQKQPVVNQENAAFSVGDITTHEPATSAPTTNSPSSSPITRSPSGSPTFNPTIYPTLKPVNPPTLKPSSPSPTSYSTSEIPTTYYPTYTP